MNDCEIKKAPQSIKQFFCISFHFSNSHFQITNLFINVCCRMNVITGSFVLSMCKGPPN